MARWDEILSLPVQNPPTLEFSASDIVWSKVEGWRDNLDRLALIPFARVDDFVRGESANKDCPTRFHVEARRRRPPQTSYKQKVDGILEYILYWCSFGPDDHRKGGIVRPSRTTYVPKKKNAGRPNTKRGCTCHFIVKRLIAEPSVALIIYNQDKHVDKKGLPCHGPQDKKAEGTRAMFAPYISEDLRLRVLSLLYVGVSVETIMQRHNETVERQGGPCNRDDLLTHRYVRRQERSIRRSTYELDTDDAVSINLWVESHQNQVFFFEDFSDSEPFTLGIQTEWQLQQMIRFGNRGLVASDSRFGTNKLKYPVHSVVVFNLDNKAIPVAWIIAPRFASADAHRWMRALYNRVCMKDPSWKEVFQCSVLISFWRVRHAWHKNLIKRCMGTEMRVQISRRLGQIVDDICKGQGTACLFEVFMEDFVDGSSFMDYFKATWYPRIGSWTTALKNLPLASQETCAAMEFYHRQLKVRLLNEKNPGVYQRADWLVDKLGTNVHSYFWLDEYSERDDFARYWKDEWVSGLTSWRKALKIPDSDVVEECRCVKVTDQLDRDRVHVVWNPGSEFAICDCKWAEMGNLCEHVFKVIKLYRDKGIRKSSISLFQYNQALINMLRCPPYDCLIRDHAASLAVAVQKQLDGIVNFDSRQANVDTTEKKSANSLEQQVVCGTNSSNQDKELVNENYHIEKDDCQERDIHEISRGVTSDITDGVREESACARMDVDPSSNSISPPRIHSADDVTQKQVDLDSNQSAVDATQKQARDSLEQQMSGTNLSNQARELVNESDCMDKDVSSLNRNDHQVRHEASGSHRDDFVDGVGEQVACSQMDIDPPTTCISLPGLLSVNEIASNESFENGDRIINAVSDMSKSPSPDVSTDQVRHEHNSVMDVRPLSNDILPSVESMEQCSVTNQNVAHNKDPKPLVSTNTEDASTDNEMMKPESEGGSRTESHRCDDNAFSLKGVGDNKASNSNLHQVVEAADSLNSESSPRSSSISRCIEEQPSGQIADGLVASTVSDKGHEVACVAASDGKHSRIYVTNLLSVPFSFVLVHILLSNSF
ncbi:ZINC ION BINDING PROTEIN [Salix koriyanagi]|uniref:ZINC ION BINDING PROTEIN n=1 Tax=Salix koriyanagi TaxID=2511006 RepID=A0A9Q0Z611_9ROSI|nr:ZINC ION BINDING PROTEIN [Salix koriyanagi]